MILVDKYIDSLKLARERMRRKVKADYKLLLSSDEEDEFEEKDKKKKEKEE